MPPSVVYSNMLSHFSAIDSDTSVVVDEKECRQI